MHSAEIPALSAECFQAVIDYIYTTEIEIDEKYVKELVKACDYLQLANLKEECDMYISEMLETSNSMSMFMFARQYGLDQTKAESKDMLLHNLGGILKEASSDEFQCLNEEALIELISDDKLDVEDESIVFELVEKWTNADSERDNETCIENILQHVRLALCNPSYLVLTVEKSPLLKFAKCQLLLNEAKNFALLKLAQMERGDFENERTKPREGQTKDMTGPLVLIGGDQKLWKLDAEKKEWTELGTLPQDQQKYPYRIGTCIIGDEIILCGGSTAPDGGEPTANAWSFNITDNTWTALPSMTQARMLHGVTTDGESVYALGGADGSNDIMFSSEVLDKNRQRWTTIAPMKHATDYNYAFYIAGSVYVISHKFQLTQEYNISRKKWSCRADIVTSSPDQDSCATNLGQYIYIAGGRNTTTPLQQYDSATDEWIELASNKEWHCRASLVPYKGRLYLCGGKDTTTIEEYDIDKDEWMASGIDMPEELMGHSVLALK